MADSPERSRKLVSVVVVNYLRAELLRACLKSLLDQTWPRLEILVVDNGSRDHSTDVVSSFADRGIRLLALTENRGFAAAVNLGVRRARGELVALLNNDAVASPEWIEQLVTGLDASPDVGMCASKILFYGSDVIDKAGHLIFPDGQNRGRGTGEPDRGQYERTREVLAADGCAALYRKEVLKQAGGFDERFFAYAEDADLALRARWLGWRCLYVPGAVVHHHHSSTLGPYSPRKIYWVERNRLWLALKNFPLPLLLLNPFFSIYRLAWNLCAALLRRGAAGNFRREGSLWLLLRVQLQAWRDALAGAGPMLRKRRRIRTTRKIGDLEFCRHLFRFRISAYRLAFGDKERRQPCRR
ncbi:MAG: glycosyltransferase family 2 protein [Candidatus Aminicenantes bacterium]|nr:glycosyltransferase family 2 protein [Candidatus Aminicenantes bacterium]